MDSTAQGRYGVVDGPNGRRWVIVPSRVDEARRLRDGHSRQFWCTTQAGGCGAQLSLKAGDQRQVHFAHFKGQGEDCPFRFDFDAEENSYLHLALQYALQDWLSTLGIASELEQNLRGAGGRADLLVSIPEGDQTIEVQLSPLATNQWETRTDRYLRTVTRVSWLFGPYVAEPVVRAAEARQGYALRLRLIVDPVPVRDMDRIEIGTQIGRDVTWTPLARCTMTAHGVTTPQVENAARAHAERLKQLIPAVELRPRPLKPEGGSGGGQIAQRPVATPEPVERAAPRPVAQPLPPIPTKPRGYGRAPLAAHDHLRVSPKDAQAEWAGLPAALRYPAAVMAAVVTRIEGSASAWSLSFPDVDDGTLIQEALLAAGLIEIYEGTRGVVRWRRPGY